MVSCVMEYDFWTDNTQFNKYVKACGSKFAAIMYVSKLARRRMKAVDNCIPESKALLWIVTGIEPPAVAEWRDAKAHRVDRIESYVEDRINYIDDIDVRKAVARSIEQSKQANHLIYRYQGVPDTCRRARVRILCRMIWDELKKLEACNKI